MTNKVQSVYKLANSLCAAKKSGAFWNLIRKSKRESTNYDAINIEKLHEHFSLKFKDPKIDSSFISHAGSVVQQKMDDIQKAPTPDIIVSEARVKRLIRQLKLGCSAGVDHITSEHLRYGIDSMLPLHLSSLFSICLRYGVLPESFYTGLLVPILKKSTLDPCDAANYRPITVSVILSKVLELFILEESAGHEMDPAQFGFVPHRGTNTAMALAHDVSAYCQARGSATFMCSLDAEGAFDAIPHSVLFLKAADTLPDHCWRGLFIWYKNMSIL